MYKPLLICMTPVRNEAWILHAFLKATSLWADYIIIADQMSTDGSREIALSYPKVILIDNTNSNFNESERQSLLINKAREIEGDKILFGLDADEIFSADYTKTQDWQTILNSKPKDVFWFKWAEICPNQKEYWESKTIYYPWAFNDDGIEPHGNYVRSMHSMRIPYPIKEEQMFYVNDFKVLHLAYLNSARVDSKRRFYKFVDWEMNNRSVISLSRSYAQTKKKDPIYQLSKNCIYLKPKFEFNLFEDTDISSNSFWFDNYIIDRIKDHPMKKLRLLDIWDNAFVKEYNLTDPRSFWIKLIHRYLKITEQRSKNVFVRITDNLLKEIGL